mgnify:CR=1 FL=1
MNDAAITLPSSPGWPGDGVHRVPYWVYTDPDTYRRELERFYYAGHWCYIGLEAKIPNPGDFRRSVVGERSVIMVRAQDGSVRVLENVCAHRGAQFCRLHGRQQWIGPALGIRVRRCGNRIAPTAPG